MEGLIKRGGFLERNTYVKSCQRQAGMGRQPSRGAGTTASLPPRNGDETWHEASESRLAQSIKNHFKSDCRATFLHPFTLTCIFRIIDPWKLMSLPLHIAFIYTSMYDKQNSSIRQLLHYWRQSTNCN